MAISQECLEINFFLVVVYYDMNCKCLSCWIYISLKQKRKEEKKDLQRLLLMVSD